jgi:pyruvate formate lyase activating enzyme
MIVWFAGCNFRCPFCQNGGIVPINTGREESIKTVKAAIDENVRWIDGVVFSGGEPTLQRDPLVELARHAKKRKRGVMVDTNGSRPGVLDDILSQDIVDRVSLDLKSAPGRYSEVTGVDWAPKVLETLGLSLKSDAEVEVRTTIVPGLVDRRDVEAIAPLIGGCDVYYLQQFRPEGNLLDPALAKVQPPLPKDMMKLARVAKKHVDRVGIKTREFGIQYL